MYPNKQKIHKLLQNQLLNQARGEVKKTFSFEKKFSSNRKCLNLSINTVIKFDNLD